MNNKVVAVVWILAFAVLIGGALVVYNSLSGRFEAPSNLAPPSPAPSQNQSVSAASSGTQNGKPEPEPNKPQNGAVAAATPPASAQNGTDAANPADAQTETEDDRFTAPDFTVFDANGAEVRLSELFGKPIVVNFWASWCPPCKSEMPEFNKVYEEMGADILFMMIDLVDGQRETMEIGARYVADQGFTFPIYYDTKGEAGYNYSISSIPTTIFIDKDGYIITGAIGAIDEQTLRKGIGYILY